MRPPALAALLLALASTAWAAGMCDADYNTCVQEAERALADFKSSSNEAARLKAYQRHYAMVQELRSLAALERTRASDERRYAADIRAAKHHPGGGWSPDDREVRAKEKEKEAARREALAGHIAWKADSAAQGMRDAKAVAGRPSPGDEGRKEAAGASPGGEGGPARNPALLAAAGLAEESLRKPGTAPPPPGKVLEVSRAYSEAGSPKDAVRVLTEDAKTSPRAGGDAAAYGEALGGAARSMLGQGDNAGALSALDAAVGLSPSDASLRSLRAKALLLGGDKEAARAEARRALALDPGDETAKLIAGVEGLSRAGRVAAQPLGFGPASAPDRTPEGGSSPGAGPAPAPGSAAAIAAEAARPSPRLGSMTRAQPPSPSAPAVAALLRQAESKVRLGDYASALVDLAQALDEEPGNAAARILRAEVLNAMGQPGAALKDAEEALKAEPRNPRALRAKAYALIGLGRHREALEAARLATELEPGNGLGWLYRAMAEEKLGMTAEAVAHYRRAMELDPALSAPAREALKRLGEAGPRRPLLPSLSREALRGGLLALALLLIAAGLLGTETGRQAVSTAGRLLTGRGSAAPAEESRETPTVEPGATLGGHFQVLGELGRGGMGVVYEAEDLALQRRVAIKRLRRESRGSAEELVRFLAEARLAAKLRHPNIAEILTVLEDGDVFLVFEKVEGLPLDALLARKGALPPAEARGILSDVCAALDFAHSRRVIHRDLKPSNVMVTPEGACKVMDLGIAHQASGLDSTRTAAAGTPPYMAPEQMMGSVSPASDLYALGVMAYELLSGRRPFQGPDFIGAKLDARFPPATETRPGLPPGLDPFFRRALDPDPRRRPASAAEFLRELGAALGG